MSNRPGSTSKTDIKTERKYESLSDIESLKLSNKIDTEKIEKYKSVWKEIITEKIGFHARNNVKREMGKLITQNTKIFSRMKNILEKSFY